MRDPYTTEDGHSYEKEAIEEWLLRNDTSPMTGAKLQRKVLIPAINLRNSIEEWRISQFNRIKMSELVIDFKEIGRGSFKTVYKAVWSCPGAPVPKVVAVLKMRSGTCDAEARTLIKLGRHPRVVRFHGICNLAENEYMITEYAEFGSLVPGAFDLLEDRGWEVTPGHALAIMQQVCSGMEALAAAGIVHRDLAGRNVLLFAFDPADVARTSAKVSDFGPPATTPAPTPLPGPCATWRPSP
jgi:serine/threonine protein kinase